MNQNEIMLLVIIALGQILFVVNYNDQLMLHLSCYKTRRICMAIFLTVSLIGVKFPLIYYMMVAFYVSYLFAVCKPIVRAVLAEMNMLILAMFYNYPIVIPHIVGMALLTVYLEYRVNKSGLIENK